MIKEEIKRDELLCYSEFHKQGKERLPKMKQDFSRITASELESQNLTESMVDSLLESDYLDDDLYSMFNQLFHIPNKMNTITSSYIYERISESVEIINNDKYILYCYTSGLDCSLDGMYVSTLHDNEIEVDYPKPESKYEFIISDYLRNKRPSGKIPTEMFIECESESEDNLLLDVFNMYGSIKVSKLSVKKKQPIKKLLITGYDNFGRGIQALLSQQGENYICKFSNNSIEIYNGIEYFGQTTFNDTYHTLSLEKSFSKLLLSSGEFKSQLILKYARFLLAAKLLCSSDSTDRITQLQKVKSNILWSCSWKNWEYVGPNILTDLSATTALDTSIDELFEQGIELGAPIKLPEYMRKLFQVLESNEENPLEILDLYKTNVLPLFNQWYQNIRN